MNLEHNIKYREQRALAASKLLQMYAEFCRSFGRESSLLILDQMENFYEGVFLRGEEMATSDQSKTFVETILALLD